MKFYLILLFRLFIFSYSKIQLNFGNNTYTKTEEINRVLSLLTSKCAGNFKEVSISEVIPGLPTDVKNNLNVLKYYDITSKSNYTNKQNVFILGGEHPRELIASEVVFDFVKFLCKSGKESNYLLQNFNFRIIVLSNPTGRVQVEQGNYCKRTNYNNVDINRNWDFYWGRDTNTAEENPGSNAFSEIETKFVLDSVKDFSPKLFLTIHSGVYGLYLPYAYLEKEGKNMSTILNEIKDKHCSICHVGSPAKLIGYKSSGTCLDYIYDNFKVPYSFAWEIYSNEKELPEMKRMIEKRKSLSGIKGGVTIVTRDTNYKIKTQTNPSPKSKSSFVTIKEADKLVDKSILEWSSNYNMNLRSLNKNLFTRTYTDSENDICVSLFNPISKIEFDYIIDNWRKALVTLLNYVKNN